MRPRVLADAAEKYGAAISRVFERVSVKGVAESVRSLATHADFCKAVEEDSALQVEALQRSSAEASAAATAAAAAAARAEAEAADLDEDGHGASAHAAQQQPHVRFHVESSPAVISPLCSPLVVRCGPLLRQSGGLMKSWKPVRGSQRTGRRAHVAQPTPPHCATLQVLGVLTRDGFLHLFKTDAEDLASHTDLVAAVFAAPPVSARSSQHAAGGDAPGAGGVPPLPPPALSPALIALAASLAANVGDIEAASSAAPALGSPTQHAVSLARAAAEHPSASVQILPTTALSFLPSLHPHAWEIGGERGSWFGGGRQVLRAGSVEEAAEWVVACTQMQDALAPVGGGGGAGGSAPVQQPPQLPRSPMAAAPEPQAQQPPAAPVSAPSPRRDEATLPVPPDASRGTAAAAAADVPVPEATTVPVADSATQ